MKICYDCGSLNLTKKERKEFSDYFQQIYDESGHIPRLEELVVHEDEDGEDYTYLIVSKIWYNKNYITIYTLDEKDWCDDQIQRRLIIDDE